VLFSPSGLAAAAAASAPVAKDARGAIFIVFIIVGRFAVIVCGAGRLILANLVGLLSVGVLAGLANLIG